MHLDPLVKIQIRQILLNDWDPQNVIHNDSAHGAYDRDVEPLHQLIEAGATEDQVVAFLHERERETMCFPSLGTERLRRPARRLIRAVRG